MFKDGFLAGWFTQGLLMALTTFLLEPLFHADVMWVTVLLVGFTLDTRAGKSSSWKAAFLAVAVYVRDIPDEMVGAAEEDKLGKSSSFSLTRAGWGGLWGRERVGITEATEPQGTAQTHSSPLLLRLSLRVAQQELDWRILMGLFQLRIIP